MRWYAERQALRQGHAERERASAQAQEILQGLRNGDQAGPIPSSGGRDLDAELAAFDRKVYAAQATMESSMTSELKTLGVPFFGTEQSAVVQDEEARNVENLSAARPKHSPVVTESQLLELRRRIVGHLEDLYRD